MKDYIYMEGEYVAHVEQTGNTGGGETQEQLFYEGNDHLGQPMVEIRADEKVGSQQFTNPFGQMYASYTNTSLGTGPTAQNIRFPGQYYDSETGYSQNWNRDYDPSVGRYVQSDPIGLAGGINIYIYTNANPIMNIDPMGLSTLTGCLNPVNAAACAEAGEGGGAKIIPFPPIQKDCPSDDGCAKEAAELESEKSQLSFWYPTNFANEWKAAVSYNQKVKALNSKIKAHNARCPKNQVSELSLYDMGKSF